MKKVPGINIQWPWSDLIASGEKTVETRTYALPERHIGKVLAIIETPGRTGSKAGIFKARIIGTVRFSGSFEYRSKDEWIKDINRHRVNGADPDFRWRQGKRKYGWIVASCSKLPRPTPPPAKRGIVFAKECIIP